MLDLRPELLQWKKKKKSKMYLRASPIQVSSRFQLLFFFRVKKDSWISPSEKPQSRRQRPPSSPINNLRHETRHAQKRRMRTRTPLHHGRLAQSLDESLLRTDFDGLVLFADQIGGRDVLVGGISQVCGEWLDGLRVECFDAGLGEGKGEVVVEVWYGLFDHDDAWCLWKTCSC